MLDLHALLTAQESETVERKEAWTEDCLKALAALANTQGGTLLVGVSDDGHIVGWHGDGKEQERISSQIVNNLHVHPRAMRIEMHINQPFLIIEMVRAATPVALRGRYYRRVGNSTREIPEESLPRFLLEKTGQSWDGIPCEFGHEALDGKIIEDFKVLARKRLPKISPSDNVKTILHKLKLSTQDGRLLRAAILLFGGDPQRVAPSAQIQVGRFKDDTTILDDRRLDGNLFQQLDQVTEALRHYLLVRYEIPKDMADRRGVEALQRQEVWEYPYDALREGIINALVHRDYTSTGRIQLRVYDDRVVISNPGGLPEGLTVEELFQDPHESLPRNPILAQMFYYADLIEQWGSGTLRMIDSCRAQGMPEPEFKTTSIGFSVTFYKDPYTERRLHTLGVSERQIKAIQFMRTQGSIGNTEYQTVTGVAKRTATRDLEDLEQRGIIKATAEKGRGTRYELSSWKRVESIP